VWDVVEAGEDHTGFWWGDPKERSHLQDLGLDRTIILKWIFKNWDGKSWTEIFWLMIWTGGRNLWMK